MKKLKQLSLILFLSVGLLSCESEKADVELNNQNHPGEQIFRLALDGKTRVTKNVSVTTAGTSVLIQAVFNDEESDYKAQTFSISLNKLEIDTYISSVGGLLPNIGYGIASATFKHHNVNWTYSTQNAPVTTPNVAVQTGSLEILSINDKANYFEGNFEFDLYAPKSANPNNLIAPVRIREGYFQYLKY